MVKVPSLVLSGNIMPTIGAFSSVAFIDQDDIDVQRKNGECVASSLPCVNTQGSDEIGVDPIRSGASPMVSYHRVGD